MKINEMCLGNFSIHEWEKEKMDKYVELKSYLMQEKRGNQMDKLMVLEKL